MVLVSKSTLLYLKLISIKGTKGSTVILTTNPEQSLIMNKPTTRELINEVAVKTVILY